MDVTALCFRLLIDVLVLLAAQVDHCYHAQNVDAGFPRISPNRPQFFEYESISVNCEEFSGLSEWRVMRKLSKIIPTNSNNWESSATSCTIQPAFERHSGEYWCEDAEGQRSEAVNITVTAGSVILESPAHPVVEGRDVTLRCRNKNTQSHHIPEYYKDGVHLGTFYESIMIIKNVSTSDEGLYKCSIPGAGESPQSRLAVLNQSKAAYNKTGPPHHHHHSTDLLSLLWIIVGSLSVALVLLVMGLLFFRKHRVLACFLAGKPLSGSHFHVDHTGEDAVVDSHHATYAVVKKQRKKKVPADDNPVDPDDVTYAVVQNKRKKKEPEVSRAAIKPRLPEESVIYSSVYHRPLALD